MTLPVPIHSFSLNSTMNDSHGDSNGTLTSGSETYSNGRYGDNKGFLFDGSTGIGLANESNLDFERTDAFSVEFVIFLPAGYAAIDAVIAKTNDTVGVTDAGFGIITVTAPEIIFRLNDGTVRISKSTSTLATDAWHHFTCTYSGNSSDTGISIYHQGLDDTVSDISGTLTSTILNNRVPSIGHESDGGRDLAAGVIVQNVNIYNVELDAAQAWNAYTNHLLLIGSAELDLWDGKVATRKAVMGRTFSWDSVQPTVVQIAGQPFIDTTLKGIYRYNETLGVYEDVILSEEQNISRILALV